MKKVSELDIRNLALIRESVSTLISKASELDKRGLKVLDVAPQIHLGAAEFFNRSDVSTLDIDVNSKATFIADLCNDNSNIIPSAYFDVIICTEVLEHTLNPFNATKELYRLLKPGGTCFVTTPFNFRIHGPLPDCWRFTEHGLRELFKTFVNVKIDSVESNDRFLMPVHYKVIAQK